MTKKITAMVYTVYLDHNGTVCVLGEREATKDDDRRAMVCKLHNVFSDIKGNKSLFDGITKAQEGE